jgi:hypothetical protein
MGRRKEGKVGKEEEIKRRIKNKEREKERNTVQFFLAAFGLLVRCITG